MRTRRRRLDDSHLIFVLLAFLGAVDAFNLDTAGPIYKTGVKDTYFGFAVAGHFNGATPVMLVGAPRAESGQKGTTQAGAMFACPISAYKSDCKQVLAEYEDLESYSLRPDQVLKTKPAWIEGKNYQQFGASISSQARADGTAMVCAPLMAFNNVSAYQYGACYYLSTDLRLKDQIVTCQSEGLPTANRYNDFSSCLQGFSSYLDDDLLITGMPGARHGAGGVFARTHTHSSFDESTTKYTMFMENGDNGRASVSIAFRNEEYVGWSVKVGRFGFAHEAGKKRSIVTGVPRMGKIAHGGVTILPFDESEKRHSEKKKLLMTEDKFTINATQLGSGAGFAIEVLDLDNDGWDDLLMAAPFERYTDGDGLWGGTVRVYYSQGKERGPRESSLVFHDPIVIRGTADMHSQFGTALVRLGNIDGDSKGYQDFAVGAPFANDGAGAVFIYHGGLRESLSTKPVQVILPSDLPAASRPFRAFGYSLSGAMDVDSNGYPDLAIGSVLADTITILRSRPVIKLDVEHSSDDARMELDRRRGCPGRSKTCLELSLFIAVEKSNATSLINLNEDVFTCTLEILQPQKGVATRALIAPIDRIKNTWPCGKNAHQERVAYKYIIHIPSDESTGDFLHPLSFKFSVAISGEKRPEAVREGKDLPNLARFPMLDTMQSSHQFEIPFNTKCGDDHTCQADLKLAAVLDGISKQGDMYVSNVGEKEYLDVDFVISNGGEKAYASGLWLSFDPDELEEPSIVKRTGGEGKAKPLTLNTIGDNLTHIALGNPMDTGAKYQFSIRFKLVRGRSQSIGRPIEFHAKVNSTSEEVTPLDNEWRAKLRIIKKAELELTGVSDPQLVRYGGEVKGASAMHDEDDIGVMLRHNYTLYNRGKWTVRNITAKFQWPYQVASPSSRAGKYALYLLELPTITTFHPDGTIDIKECSVEHPKDAFINPETDIRLNTFWSTIGSRRSKRSPDEADSGLSDSGSKSGTDSVLQSRVWGTGPSKDRIKPVVRTDESGVDVKVTTIGCPSNTAKCFTVTCRLDYIDANSAPVIDFRARLWNSTFVEDYFDVEFVEIISSGSIEIDPNQGLEDDPSNNHITVTTLGYPDRPSIDASYEIPWWIIAVAVLAGLLVLLLLALLLWKCGFFKRNRPSQYHTAELHHERELWAKE